MFWQEKLVFRASAFSHAIFFFNFLPTCALSSSPYSCSSTGSSHRQGASQQSCFSSISHQREEKKEDLTAAPGWSTKGPLKKKKPGSSTSSCHSSAADRKWTGNYSATSSWDPDPELSWPLVAFRERPLWQTLGMGCRGTAGRWGATHSQKPAGILAAMSSRDGEGSGVQTHKHGQRPGPHKKKNRQDSCWSDRAMNVPAFFCLRDIHIWRGKSNPVLLFPWNDADTIVDRDGVWCIYGILTPPLNKA